MSMAAGPGVAVLALLMSAVLGGCSSSKPATPAPPGPGDSQAAAVRREQAPPMAAAPVAARASAAPAAEAVLVPDASRQLVLGVASSWDETAVELWLFEREPGGEWAVSLGPWPGVLGVSGLAWGRGLHGHGVPADQPGPLKREGDGRSPAGLFALTSTYGYAVAATSAMPYTQVGKAWQCIDDQASAAYNQIIDTTGRVVDWKSAELMRQSDELYEWVIEVAHNQPASPGAGSCIFLHVWRGPGKGTAGCTAMARDRIEHLLARLDPEKSPVYVLLPRDRAAALKVRWGLPALPMKG